MTKNAWFRNRETFVTGSMSFDHIFFNEDVTVEVSETFIIETEVLKTFW